MKLKSKTVDKILASHTPGEMASYSQTQEAVKISQSFLAKLNIKVTRRYSILATTAVCTVQQCCYNMWYNICGTIYVVHNLNKDSTTLSPL